MGEGETEKNRGKFIELKGVVCAGNLGVDIHEGRCLGFCGCYDDGGSGAFQRTILAGDGTRVFESWFLAGGRLYLYVWRFSLISLKANIFNVHWSLFEMTMQADFLSFLLFLGSDCLRVGECERRRSWLSRWF